MHGGAAMGLQRASACNMSHVTRHTSHVTRHKSHATRHTSHVTRHASHVTRHARASHLGHALLGEFDDRTGEHGAVVTCDV